MTIKECPKLSSLLRDMDEERAYEFERVLSQLDYLDVSLREAQRDVTKLKNIIRELI
jgi:hypothetical protein